MQTKAASHEGLKMETVIVFEKIEKVQRFYFQLLTKIEVEPFKLQLLDSTIVCYTASANEAAHRNCLANEVSGV